MQIIVDLLLTLLLWIFIFGIIVILRSVGYLLFCTYKAFKNGVNDDNDYNNWINEQRN